MTKPLENPQSCFICRRRADGVGVGKPGSFGWICSECGPSLGKKVYHMTDKAFDAYEVKAIDAAGNEAGGYLDGIGKSDLASLTEDEWRHFLRTVLRSFGEAIRREVESGNAPF